MEPRLTFKETLTDNLALSATDEQDEAVTQVNPGVAVHQKAARSTLDVDYALQSLTYANDPSHNDIYHNLSSKARQRLVADNLFVAERVSVTQQIIDPSVSVPSDVINPGNVSNVVSYSVAPRARGSLGGIVDMSVDYRYGGVHYLDTDAASDSMLTDVTASLKNAKHGSRLSWGINYNKSVTDRSGAVDANRESSDASLRYTLSQSLFVYAAGGMENYSLQATPTARNGAFWRAGLGWTPGPDLTIQASSGDRSKEASLNWAPITRTSLMVSYLNQNVGVNPGVTWSGLFQHRTPNTTWRAHYSEGVINVQRLELTGQRLFVLVDAKGSPILDPTTGQAILVLVNDFTLTDQDFIRKRGSVGLSARSAFTVSGIEVFHETREYQISGGSEQQKGISGTLVWKYTGRTSLRVSGSLSRWSSDSISGSDRLDREQVGVVRRIDSHLTGSLSYSHAARNSADRQRNYSENRVEAELTKRW